jgi:glyoxylase-like metal-dependent hydrolase (beta-lactamase superfamily II)
VGASVVTEHVYRVSLGMVNVFLIVSPDQLTMIDAGYRKSWGRIDGAIRELGKRPEDVDDILVTHLHADHTGGLARAQEATGARVWMHPIDAAPVRAGEASRPWKRAPGSIVGMLAQPLAGDRHSLITPVRVLCEATDGHEIAAAGGITPVWTPGHTQGHVVYLWPQDGGVLFVGDAAARMARLRSGPIYEDYEQGLDSLRLISQLEFQTACFSHGRPLVGGAQRAFRKEWP